MLSSILLATEAGEDDHEGDDAKDASIGNISCGAIDVGSSKKKRELLLDNALVLVSNASHANGERV